MYIQRTTKNIINQILKMIVEFFKSFRCFLIHQI
jgi:hypothetical protein